MPQSETQQRLSSYAPDLSDEEKFQLLDEFEIGQPFRPSRVQSDESFGLSDEEKSQLLGEFKIGREEQKPEKPEGPGFVSKAISVVGGGILGAGETWGRAIRAFPGGEEAGVGEEGISGAILKTTRGMREALPKEPEDPGAIYQGIQSAITSLVSRAPQMAAGAALGSAFGPVGTFMGALGGYVFGGAPLFGMAEYDSFIENAKQSDRYKQGKITDEQIESGAITSGLHETGWEYASDILTGAITLATGGIGAPVGKAGMTALKEWAKTLFKASGKEMAKRAGAIIAGEVSTEMATAGFQTEELYKLGLTDQRFTDGMTQAFGPAFVASLIFAGFFEGGVRLNRRATKNALENPSVSPEERMGAVDYVHSEMSKITPEIADTWRNLATQAVENNEAITLDEKAIDETSDLYSNKIFAPEKQQILEQEWEAAEAERLRTPEGRQAAIEAEMAPATPMTTISEETTSLAEMAPEKAEERMAAFGRIPTGEIIGEEERIVPEIVTPTGRPVEAESLEARIMAALEKEPFERTAEDQLLLQELTREEGVIKKPMPAPMRAFGMKPGKRSPVEMSKDIADEIVKTEKELSDEEYATFWETNLNKLDYLYKSPQGIVKLREQLEAEEAAGNIAPEYAIWWGEQLDRIDQVRQSVIGAEGLKGELTAKERKEIIGRTFGMKPEKKEPEVVKPEKKEPIKFVGTRIRQGKEVPIFEATTGRNKGYQIDYNPELHEIANLDEYEKMVAAKSVPSKPAEAKPPEALREEIEAEGIVGVAPEKPIKPIPSKIRTLRGAIKEIGGIDFLNYSGELKDLDISTKRTISKKGALGIDQAVDELIADGWLDENTTVASFLEELRTSPTAMLGRDRITADITTKKPHELSAEEKRLKEEMEHEPEAPPEGEYVTLNAEDLPVGKKMTLIEGKTGEWDTYKIEEKDAFSITLKDGKEITLSPLDKVQVLKKDVKKTEDIEIIDPDGTYVNREKVKTIEKDGLKAIYYGTYRKDGAFKAWKTAAEIDKIKKAEGKVGLDLKQEYYGKQAKVEPTDKMEQRGLGLEVEDKTQFGLFEKPTEKPVEDAKSRIKASTTDIIKGKRGSFSFETKEGAATFEDFKIVGKDFMQRGADTFNKFVAQMKKTFGEVWESVKHLARQIYDSAKAVLTEERGEVTIREEKLKKPDIKKAFKVLGIKPKLKPEEPLPKRARSVGLAYQNISDEAKRLEVEMGLEYPKTTRTHAELRGQADRIMGDQEQLLKTMAKEKNFTEAEGLVIRRAAVTGLESLMKIVAAKDIKKANEMHKTFKEGIGNKLQDLHSEYGRNLESLKEVVSPESIAKAFAGLKRNLSKEDMERFNSAAEALGQGDVKPMVNFQKHLKATETDPKIMDYVYEYWYNSILSGIPTHVVNIASNTAWSAWQVGVHKPLLAALDPFVAKFQKRPTEYYMAEIIPALAGIKRGFKPGIKGAKEMLLKGYTTNAELDKFAADMGKSVGAFSRSPNKYLKAIAPFLTMPTRALRGMDIWAKQMNYEAELGSIAKRMEKKGEGKYEELLKNPTESMMQEASQYADYTTFMGKLGKVGTMIESLRTAVPGGRFIMPFVRTIANLVQRGVEMTPVVGAMKLLGGKVKGKEVTQVLVKQIEGAMIALVVASMFDDDEITGDVPANKAEREAFYRQGKKPWSIKIGDTWYQYRRIEPFNTPVAAVGILYDTWKRTGKEPSTEFVYRSAAGFVNNIIDSSYLSGLTQVLDSVRKADKWPQKLSNMFDRTIASFSPMSSFQRSFVRAIEAIDKEGAVLRKPKGAVETLAAATPFISEMVPARKDVWGKEIIIPGSPLAQWLPWKAAKATTDVVEKEIERLHATGMSYPGMPAKYMTIAGKRFDLNDEQYDMLITEGGKAAKKKLDQLIGTSYWKMLSDEEKASRIQRIIKDKRKKARAKIKKQLGIIPGLVPWKKRSWHETGLGKKKKSAWQETIF